jgi:hypothetical protein
MRLKNAAKDYEGRMDQYRRREHMITWVGAGLGGLFVLVGSYISGHSFDPNWWTALIVGLLLLSAGALALARVAFEWEATKLCRAIQRGKAKRDTSLSGDLCDWPREEVLWRSGLYLIPIAAATFVVGLVIMIPSTRSAPTSDHVTTGRAAVGNHAANSVNTVVRPTRPKSSRQGERSKP